MEAHLMASERRDPPDGPEPDRESTLVEHSNSGRRFTRLFGDTFSLEDGFTLKHVAAVVAVLLVVVIVFGLISLVA
jgi:hypothetical protein